MENTKIELNVKWGIPWLAGFMFTFGFCTEFVSGLLSNQGWWTVFCRLGSLFGFWPLVLGIKLSEPTLLLELLQSI